jgi:hypothetical protein
VQDPAWRGDTTGIGFIPLDVIDSESSGVLVEPLRVCCSLSRLLGPAALSLWSLVRCSVGTSRTDAFVADAFGVV